MTVSTQQATVSPITVRGLGRGLDLLSLFDDQTTELTVGEISVRLDLPLSTTYRIVNTLVGRGFLERHRPHGTVRLGLALIRLGRLASASRSLADMAIPELKLLSRDTGETAVLMVPQPNHVVCLANVEGTYPIRPRSIGVGEQCPYNAGAVPLAILAFLPRSEQDRILAARLPAVTHNTLHSKRTVQKRCEEIRAAGFAFSREEAIEGTAAVAAPILAEDGVAVLGSVGVTGVTDRIASDLGPRVLEAADRIAERMGRSPGDS